MATELPSTIEDTQDLLNKSKYVADRSLATTLFLALKMGRPLFLEGEAGVGKTEIAKVLAEALGRRLVRLQCYEGLDISSAVYEWNYSRQMIEIRLAEAAGDIDREHLSTDIFSKEFLIERPLLQALRTDESGAPVLLIDELDRTDEPFEAYLLEILSDFQITVPEIGTIKASEPPIVIITSNRTSVATKLPDIDKQLTEQIVSFVQRLREEDLFKLPGVAETLDWADALTQLDKVTLDGEAIDNTLGTLLKYQDDIAKIRGSEAAKLLEQVKYEISTRQSVNG
jgi:MoxR-like ATPase